MHKHASMNRAYRIVWSAARGAFVVAAETARGRTAPERKTDRVVKNEVSGARGAQPIRYERSRGLQQFARAIQINRLGTVDHHQIGDGQSGRDLAVE